MLASYNVFYSYGKSKQLAMLLAGEISRKRGNPFLNGIPKWHSLFLHCHLILKARTTGIFRKARTGKHLNTEG